MMKKEHIIFATHNFAFVFGQSDYSAHGEDLPSLTSAKTDVEMMYFHL